MNFLNRFISIFIFYSLSIASAFGSGNTVFLDIDYVLNNSNLGKSIYLELEKINTSNINKLNKKEILLKEKKQSIDKTKNISSKEKLEEDIIIFNKELEKYRLEKNQLLNDFKVKKKWN